MKKRFIYYGIIWLISLIVFNVIVFVTPNEVAGMSKFGGAFWSGYIFITIAFLGQLACAYKAFKEENAKKLFYSIPLISISYTGLIVMLVIGTACMAVPNLPNWLGVIVCLLVLAFTIISVAKASAAAEIVTKIDEKIRSQTQFIKMLAIDSEQVMKSAKIAELKAEAKKVYEAIRYSDPMSNAALEEVEAQIQSEFQVFTSAMQEEDLKLAESVGVELLALIDNRNKKCRALKF